MKKDVVIIGAGIAGMTAALYLKRANKDVLLIEKGMPGGAINTTSSVKNYPGIKMISGPDFSNMMFDQIKDNGVEVKFGTVVGMEFKDDAPPAFLTDTNRLQRHVMVESLFDNSWDVYHQDLPSAEYLWQQGIRKVVLICNTPAEDLKKILYPYGKKGMEILWTKGYETPKKVRLKKPGDKD